MRQAGEVTFADAHRPKVNEGWAKPSCQNARSLCETAWITVVSPVFFFFNRVVEFASYSDLKNALEKLSGKEMNGRKIKLIEAAKKRWGSYSRLISCHLLLHTCWGNMQKKQTNSKTTWLREMMTANVLTQASFCLAPPISHNIRKHRNVHCVLVAMMLRHWVSACKILLKKKNTEVQISDGGEKTQPIEHPCSRPSSATRGHTHFVLAHFSKVAKVVVIISVEAQRSTACWLTAGCQD